VVSIFSVSFFFLFNISSTIFFLVGGNFFFSGENVPRILEDLLWDVIKNFQWGGELKGKSKGILNQDPFVCGGVWMIQSNTMQCEELIVTLEICFVTGR